MTQESFFRKSMKIAVPVALQAMLQSSFSMIDQVMVGQLGKTAIAAVEVGVAMSVNMLVLHFC
ncbi:MATE family efflux transporter [Butyrivibrio sp. VCB2006]|uniref:MATE family efflux transporter n=1 Tax=Butyrivibrio sp. VCB2006 TaxID=1280679 RepID=UPI0004923649|nr:MATE family efflux transporter [Butyrivibrio sp. VCB2006]